VGHVGYSDPFDNSLRDVIIKAVSGQAIDKPREKGRNSHEASANY